MNNYERSRSTVTVLSALIALTWAADFAEAGNPLLWPLQDGQQMEFLVQSPSQASSSKAEIKVVSTTTVGASRYFGVEILEWGRGTPETVFLRSTETGVYRLEAEGECPIAELAEFGTTFRCRTDAGGWEVTTYLAPVALSVLSGAFSNGRLFRKHIEYDNGSMSPD